MKVKAYILFSLLVWPLSVLGQTNDQMYFVQFGIRKSTDLIDNDEPETFGFPFVVFTCTSDSLQPVDTISMAPGIAVSDFMHLKDYNSIFLEKRNYFSESFKREFVFISYSRDSILTKRYNTEEDPDYKSYFSLWSAFSIGDKVFIGNEYDPPIQNELELIAINENFDKQLISTEDYQNVYMPGNTSRQYQNYTSSYLYDPQNLNILKVGAGAKDYESMLTASVQIPINYRDSSLLKVSVEINNSRVFVGQGRSSPVYDKEAGTVYKWILDKKNGRIDSLVFSSDVTYKLGNDEDWIYGTSALKEDYLHVLRSRDDDRINSMIDSNNILTKGIYDLKLSNVPFLVDKLGTILLYHLPSGKIFFINDLSRDVEVFGVKNDILYYRNFDEIREVKLFAGKEGVSILQENVIAKNKKIVPYLHCMFFSGASYIDLNYNR